ncbi:MAG: transglutaminase domain-containing protein [Candidatus Aminicenantes bacterium]|nr:transglutaminase domain-containing protein [Candidatus Aminicenantes bacterium]
MKPWRPALLLAAVLAAGPASETGGDWSVITIAGVPVGYVVETMTAPGPGGTILSSSEMKIVLNRMGNRVEIDLRSSAEETAEGRLAKVGYELRASLLSTKTEGVVKDGMVEIRSEAGGNTYSRTVAFQGELLGPEGIRRLTEKGLKKPGDIVEYQTFAAEAGAVTRGSRRALARETVRAGGRDLAVWKVEELIEAAGVKSTAWLDERAETVRAEMTTPFGLAEIVRADRMTALAAVGGAELPAELYERSILRTNIRLPKARALDYLRVELVHRNPEEGWPDIGTSGQKILSRTRETLRLEVRRPAVPGAASRPAAETAENREFLAPNEYVQSDLPEIRRLAQEIVGDEADAYRSALKLLRWVHENMIFDLGIAFAPAGELFKTRRGTCVGYATMLAALGRAAGLPTRVVMGYVYALGMFGGHAWTEVRIGRDWIPLDATIVSSGPADAARVAIASSSLADGAGGLTAGAAARLFGQVDLRVEAYGFAGGKTVEVPFKARPYEIEGGVYRNRWLGLEVAPPEGFSLTKTEAVWPDPAVAALEGPSGVRVEIREFSLLPWKAFRAAAAELLRSLDIGRVPAEAEAGGLKGLLASEDSRAAAVLAAEPTAWVVAVTGPNASAVLNLVLSGLSFR